MDAIASEAGVSKLTVYSHFTDKETLFVAAIRERCQEQMPSTLFSIDRSAPVRRQLEAIGHAFFSLITQPESIALHRLITAGTPTSHKLAQLFWDSGPRLLHDDFEKFLRQEVEDGQLEIEDVPRAASQFFALLKGELHARMLCGCSQPVTPIDTDVHVRATVEFFLRAYAACSERVAMIPAVR